LGYGQAKYFFLVPPPETSEDMLTGNYRIRTTALITILSRYNFILHIRVVL
jgi:hypothetical protein